VDVENQRKDLVRVLRETNARVRGADGAAAQMGISRTTSIHARNGSAYEVAQVYAFRSESDKAFEWLDRAYAQRNDGLI
jgi:hypothetical protein